MSKEIKTILYLSAISIFATFLFAKIVFIINQNTYSSSLIIWKRWDTILYLNLAQNGYLGALRINPASTTCLPLYPWLIRLANYIFKDYLFSGLFISNICFAIALIYLYKLLKMDFPSSTTWRTIFYFLIFPTAFFLHAAYTESLLMMCIILTVYFARKSNWFMAGIFGMFAALTRISGVVLFPTLLITYLIPIKFRVDKIKKDILWTFLPLASFVFFHLMNYYLFGNFFQYWISMKKYYWEWPTFPWTAIVRAFDRFSLLPPADWVVEGGFTIFFWFTSLILLIISIRKIPLFYNVFGWLSFLLITFTRTGTSIPRYALTFFPIFITMAILGRNRAVNYLIIITSLLLQAVFITLFVQGHWAG